MTFSKMGFDPVYHERRVAYLVIVEDQSTGKRESFIKRVRGCRDAAHEAEMILEHVQDKGKRQGRDLTVIELQSLGRYHGR